MSTCLTPRGPVDAVRHAAAVFLNRAMLAVRAGITFGGKRDLYDALGYQRIIWPIDYHSRYARGGLAKRIADAYPSATWRGGVEILEDEDPDSETEFELAVQDLARRLRLWSNIKKADVLSQQGQFSVLLIGAPGDLRDPIVEDGQQLSVDDIVYVQPYSQEDVKVQLIDADSESPRFGLPTLYQIRRLAGSAYFGYSVGSKLVHHSRIIHVADNRLDDRIFGHPILENVWNYLDDLDKITGGGAEAYWKRADQGIIFDLDKELEMDPEENQKVKDAADDFIHGFRRVMGTRGMKAQQMGSDVADISRPVDAIVTVISGATGIPKRILVGSERGELASTQDRENWEQKVSDRRNDYAGPEIVRPIIEFFIQIGVLPQPKDLIIRWPQIEFLNDQEKAQIAVQWANINKTAGAVVVLPQEIRDRVLRLEKLEEHELPDPYSPFASPEQRTVINAQKIADVTNTVAVDPYADRLSDNPTLADNLQPETTPPQASLFNPLQIASARTRYRVRGSKDQRTAIKKKLVGSAKFHIRKALKSAKRAFNHSAVRRAHTRGRSDVLLSLSPSLETMRTGLHKAKNTVSEVHHRSRKVTRLMHVSGDTARAASALRVAIKISDGSAKYAADRMADLVTDVDTQTRDNIAAVLDKAFANGWSADKTASRLENIISLSTPQATALESFRERLESGNAGDEVAVGDHFITLPSDGGSDEWIDRQVSRYSDELLADRAEMIAETSVNQAAADGQRDEWLQLQADGEISENTLRRWIASDTACDECKDLDGETAELDGEYADGVSGPLLHPFCDCDEELFEPKEA